MVVNVVAGEVNGGLPKDTLLQEVNDGLPKDALPKIIWNVGWSPIRHMRLLCISKAG